MAQVAIRPLLYPDALVRAVFTGDVTEIAANAFFRVNAGDNLVIQVEIAPVLDARH